MFWHNCRRKRLLHSLNLQGTPMDTYLDSSNWKYIFLISIFLCTFILASCSSSGANPPEPNAFNQETETPAFQNSNLVKPTDVLHTPLAPTFVPTIQMLTNTPRPSEVALRVSYVTTEIDGQNEVFQSKLWVLYPPYNSPQLLYTTENGKHDYIISAPVWSHSGKQVAFAHLGGDRQHIAFSIFDVEKQELVRVTDDLVSNDPDNTNYIMKWSNDDQWLYLDYFLDFSNGQIINVMTGESLKLNSRTQDELLEWSPVTGDQYISISRKNFPNPGKDVLCLNTVTNRASPKCFEDLGYTLLSGNTFSWSADGEKALIVAGDSSENFSYIVLNFNNMNWKLILVSEYFEPFNIWSRNNRWIALAAYRRGIRFLDVTQEQPKLDIVTEVKYPQLLGWLFNGQAMVYQSEYAVYSVNPEKPSNSNLIKDFRSLLKDEYKVYRNYSIDILEVQ